MVCFNIRGLKIAVDFTAPALLALLSMYVSAETLCRTGAACLLHECAHLLMIVCIGRKPALLRISAAGLRLETAGTAVMPLHLFAEILLAGPAANLLAAAGFMLLGMPETAAANLSLCCFNLLPFRSTDGGTLLHAWLEQHFLLRMPEMPQRIMRCTAAVSVILLLGGMYHTGSWNFSLFGMLLYMLAAEFTE